MKKETVDLPFANCRWCNVASLRGATGPSPILPTGVMIRILTFKGTGSIISDVDLFYFILFYGQTFSVNFELTVQLQF